MNWFFFFFCLFLAAHAWGLDPASEQALKDTEALLSDEQLRKGAIIENDKTKAAHEYANKVSGGGQNLNDMYGISSDIFAYLTKTYNGDAEKLQNALMQAQSNPEAFYKSLPIELQTKVRGLANKVPGSSSPQH